MSSRRLVRISSQSCRHWLRADRAGSWFGSSAARTDCVREYPWYRASRRAARGRHPPWASAGAPKLRGWAWTGYSHILPSPRGLGQANLRARLIREHAGYLSRQNASPRTEAPKALGTEVSYYKTGRYASVRGNFRGGEGGTRSPLSWLARTAKLTRVGGGTPRRRSSPRRISWRRTRDVLAGFR